MNFKIPFIDKRFTSYFVAKYKIENSVYLYSEIQCQNNLLLANEYVIKKLAEFFSTST